MNRVACDRIRLTLKVTLGLSSCPANGIPYSRYAEYISDLDEIRKQAMIDNKDWISNHFGSTGVLEAKND